MYLSAVVAMLALMISPGKMGIVYLGGDGANLLDKARFVAPWPGFQAEWTSDHELVTETEDGQQAVYNVRTKHIYSPSMRVTFPARTSGGVASESEMVKPPPELRKYHLPDAYGGLEASARRVFIWEWIGKSLADIPSSDAPRASDSDTKGMKKYLWTSLRDGSHVRYLGFLPDPAAPVLNVPGGKYVSFIVGHKVYIVPSLQHGNL